MPFPLNLRLFVLERPHEYVLSIPSLSRLIVSVNQTGLSVRKQQDEDHNMFDFDLFTSALSETANYDELKQYLSTDIEQVTNPIEWWNSKARAFPRLSRMAIDYLTIPGSLSHFRLSCLLS